MFSRFLLALDSLDFAQDHSVFNCKFLEQGVVIKSPHLETVERCAGGSGCPASPSEQGSVVFVGAFL